MTVSPLQMDILDVSVHIRLKYYRTTTIRSLKDFYRTLLLYCNTLPPSTVCTLSGHSGFINCLLLGLVSVVVQSFLFGIRLLRYP